MNRTIFALGFFDGVHLGHQALLKQCRLLAEQNHCDCGVITFSNHPDALVYGYAPVLINTAKDRERLLQEYADTVITMPFDWKLLRTPWDVFLGTLCRHYNAAGFVCGDDFRFGARGIGTPELLREYCSQKGMPCAVIPEQMLDGIRVSSSHIRTLLEAGNILQADAFLGHPHILSGIVVPGRHLGRTLGIPTANLFLPQELAIPRFGVYVTKVRYNGEVYPAVTNIGIRPTVQGKGINVEAWLLNYSGDLYGKEITLEFYQFLRSEMKFETLDDMRLEILKNAQQTMDFFNHGNR